MGIKTNWFNAYNVHFLHTDHRSHLHRHQEISPEELQGLESVLSLIKVVAEKVSYYKTNANKKGKLKILARCTLHQLFRNSTTFSICVAFRTKMFGLRSVRMKTGCQLLRCLVWCVVPYLLVWKDCWWKHWQHSQSHLRLLHRCGIRWKLPRLVGCFLLNYCST